MSIIIETTDLTRTFGDFVAVNKINLSLEQGGVYGFLGPNGSGKSTTIRMLIGLLLPTGGSGRVLDFDILTQSSEIKNQIGYVSQKFSLYDDLTVYENMDFYGGMYNIENPQRQERIKEMLDFVALTSKKDEFVSSLSGGWRQKLALVCAVLHKPKIIFLDEATSGADPNTRRLFWQLIYQFAAQGTTILVTTHFLDEAEHCDRIVFIHNGRLVGNDTPENLKTSLPGTIYKIPTQTPIKLLDLIKNKNIPLLDTYIHGQSVIVRLYDKYKDYLNQWDFQVIKPTLEDVFIYLVEKERLKKQSLQGEKS